MITLRPYQNESLEAIRAAHLSGISRQLVHLPTASGKTVIFASLIANAIKDDPATRVLILAFSTDLLDQARDKLKMIAPHLADSIGLLDAGNKQIGSKILIASIQSASQTKNLERLRKQGFSIVIADEAHHFAAKSARHVLQELTFSRPYTDSLLVGFTATPFRSDRLGLAAVFDKIVYSKTIKEMIDDGYLCRPTGHKIVTDLDLSQIPTQGGDFAPSALSRIMNTPEINGLVVASFLEKSPTRKTIAFTTNIAHAKALAECFRGSGIKAEAIHSKLPSEERIRLKTAFREGRISVLVNPLMLTEGFDEPSIECVIIARPTKSAGLYQQMAGRGLRLFPNKKDCLILDFGDVNHSLCNIGLLLDDLEAKEKPKKPPGQLQEIVDNLPQNINPRLKKAILSMDLLGEGLFQWQRDHTGDYFLKGHSHTLRITKRKDGLFDSLLTENGGKVVGGAQALDFSYAFSTAEDYARANRHLFTMSDMQAPWRRLPISDKQKDVFRSFGFKNGIDALTRGQASVILSSGALRRG